MKRRVLLSVLLIAILLAALAGVSASAASYYKPAAKSYSLYNVGTGKYMNWSGGSAGSRVNLWSRDYTQDESFGVSYPGWLWDYGRNRRWTKYSTAYGARLKINRSGSSSYYVDIESTQQASGGDYAIAWRDTRNSVQCWYFDLVSSGTYVLRNADKPNLVLTASGSGNGSPLYITGYTGSSLQKWQLHSPAASTLQAVYASASSASMTAGTSRTFTAGTSPAGLSGVTYKWTTSNSAVASGSYNRTTGKLTLKAHRAGRATLTVQATKGGITRSDSFVVTVTAPVIVPRSVSLSSGSFKLGVNAARQLTATVKPAGASQAVTWSSSRPGVASVSSTGLVRGVSRGTAVITARTSNGKKASVTVTVNSYVTRIDLSASGMTLNIGGSTKLTASPVPSNASNRAIVWSTSNRNVVSVTSSGVITARKAGTATITARTKDGSVSASCRVTVVAYSNGAITPGLYRLSNLGTGGIFAARGNTWYRLSLYNGTQMTITESGNSSYRVNAASVRSGGRIAVSAVGAGNARAQWYFQRVAANQYVIRSASNPNLVITSSGGTYVLKKYSPGSSLQIFRLLF